MRLTNENIFQIAMQQSAIDANCNVDDFSRTDNVIVISKENVSARRYLKLPHICNLISYGNNIVATISEEYEHIVREYIDKYPLEHCFETPNLHILNDAFQKNGLPRLLYGRVFLARCATIACFAL